MLPISSSCVFFPGPQAGPAPPAMVSRRAGPAVTHAWVRADVGTQPGIELVRGPPLLHHSKPPRSIGAGSGKMPIPSALDVAVQTISLRVDHRSSRNWPLTGCRSRASVASSRCHAPPPTPSMRSRPRRRFLSESSRRRSSARSGLPRASTTGWVQARSSDNPETTKRTHPANAGGSSGSPRWPPPQRRVP
jgi:hypothetical protein